MLMADHISRRQVLAAAAAGTAGLALAGTAARASGPDARLLKALADSSPRNPGSDLGAIKHVVFMMMENRSFDHVFGTLSGVRGFDDRSPGAKRTFRQRKVGKGRVLPYRYNTDRSDATCTFGPEHEWGPMQEAYHHGNLDFVRSQTRAQTTSPEITGPMTMGYYTRKDLPYYYAMADAFTVCDNYFCSVIGPTHPNRTYQISGTLDPDGKHGGPCVSTSVANFQKYSWQTAPEVLEDAGVSWKVYAPTAPPQNFDSGGVALVAGNNILMAFKQFGTKGTPLYRKAFTNDWPTTFLKDVENDKLPAVSWVWPGAVPGMDDHPAAPMSRGEYGTNVLLQALFKNKELWAKTLVVHTYDENGGYFDHVVPPVAPKGTPGEYLTVRPLPSDTEGHAGPIGLGFRVPATVISPWSRGGFVSHQRYDHVSQLLLLEERFGVRFRTISKWRRDNVGDLTGPLRMGDRSKSIPHLPAAPLDTAKMAEQCTTANLATESGGSLVPPPKKQNMPKQENGSRKVVRNGKQVRRPVRGLG